MRFVLTSIRRCITRSHLGLNHSRPLCSQHFDSLEHIHNTFTLQALNKDTQSTKHSCSTHTSTFKKVEKKKKTWASYTIHNLSFRKSPKCIHENHFETGGGWEGGKNNWEAHTYLQWTTIVRFPDRCCHPWTWPMRSINPVPVAGEPSSGQPV